MIRWALLFVATAAAVVAGAAAEDVRPPGPPLSHDRPCLGGGEHCLLELDGSGDGATQNVGEAGGEVLGKDGERGGALRDGEGELSARTDAGEDMGGGGDGSGADSEVETLR